MAELFTLKPRVTMLIERNAAICKSVGSYFEFGMLPSDEDLEELWDNMEEIKHLNTAPKNHE